MPTYLPYFFFQCNLNQTYLFIWPQQRCLPLCIIWGKICQYLGEDMTFWGEIFLVMKKLSI